jgi:hypothetical protein
MSTEEIIEIGHRELRDNLARTLKETVKQGRIGRVTCRNVADGYLISPERYAEMRDAETNVQRLHDTVPLLLAAVGAGTAIPSTTLSSLGIELPYDWRMINELQARVPVMISADEEGAPITRGSAESVSTPPESDDELIFVTSKPPEIPAPSVSPLQPDVARR